MAIWVCPRGHESTVGRFASEAVCTVCADRPLMRRAEEVSSMDVLGRDEWTILGFPTLQHGAMTVRRGHGHTAPQSHEAVEVVPAEQLRGAVGALEQARDAIHALCLERGSTDGYGTVFEAINSHLPGGR